MITYFETASTLKFKSLYGGYANIQCKLDIIGMKYLLLPSAKSILS